MAADQRLEDMPDVVTVEEAATFLRISKGLAYEAIRTGQLPSVRIGRRCIVTKAGLARFLDAASR